MEEQKIYLLMVDYLAGRTNEEEAELLMRWVNSSKLNQQEFARVKAIWNAKGVPLAEQEIAQALARTKAKMAAMESQGESRVISMKPWLRWLRNTAAVILLAGVGLFIYQRSIQEVYLTKTTTAEIDSVILSDGSKIFLSSNSRLSYPEKIKGEVRSVSLLNGEAFFEIAQDPVRPFVVTLNNSKVTVLGTSFNIRNTPRSVDVSVNSGKVSFESVYGNDKAILTAGMGLNYNISSNTIIGYPTVNQNNAYWLNKELVFVDASLTEVFESLEHCYGVKIRMEKLIKSEHKFNAEFKDTRLEEVLEVLKATYPIKLKLKNKQITVSNK